MCVTKDKSFSNTDRFLELLWGLYASDKPIYYEVFCLNDKGKKIIEFFKGIEAPEKATKWLERNFKRLAKGKYHVYFGILPRVRKPEKGRGTAKDVEMGMWLWGDLDFKQSLEKLEEAPVPEESKKVALEKGYWYEEKEDYGLVGIYRSGNKWVYVSRPRLSEVLEEVREKLGIEPTIVVDSGAGYHLYFKLKYEIEASRLRRLEEKIVDILKADPQSKDLARVLRLPGSINPRLNREVKVIQFTDSEIDPEELEKNLLTTKKTTVEYVGVSRLRELGEEEILKIVEAVAKAYRPGWRQSICLFLSGWCAKAKIDPVSVAKIIKLLYEKTGDTDPLKMRLSTIVYSYKKANLWSEDVKERFETLLDMWGLGRVSGLESAISEEVVKGKSGLQEIFEQVIGEEQALETIRNLETILGVASPFRDSIFEILDYEKQLYAVANLRRLVVVRAKREGNTIRYKERVTVGAPTKVTVYVNPLGGLTKYEVLWETTTRPKPLIIGPAPIEDIYDRLKAEGLIIHHRLARDVLNAIIEGYIRKGRAEIREEIESPGFYLVNEKIATVRWELKDVSKEELKEALEFLNELAKWYGSVIERFSLIIKWGIISPFAYVYKQKKKWIPWLYLYGVSGTGKTTLGKIVLNIWGLSVRNEKSGSSIDTVARLGHVLSQTTFPTLINEPGGAIYKEDIVEVMKSGIESTVARGKYVRGTYTEIPSLSPLIMTSNRALPRDDALIRRLIVLRFSYSEKHPEDKIKEFEVKVKPQFGKLSAIGYYVAKRITEKPELLEEEWNSLATKLLEEMYREVGLEVPEWIRKEYIAEENIYEDIREAIRVFLVKRINEEYSRFVGKVIIEKYEEGEEHLARSDVDFEDRVKIVLENKLLPWAILRKDTIIITSAFASDLKSIIGDIGGLRSIAELLGWEYQKSVKIGKRVLAAIRVNIRDFLGFLSPETT
ncbi:MAG: hypothetical protein B6U76_01435 [Desulfurococcales archaeon ex4484_217_2]|nr:MAG: hypothetical protein B6U76_01435 [Desulfurococcales archaeon ex4484_217_2]